MKTQIMYIVSADLSDLKGLALNAFHTNQFKEIHATDMLEIHQRELYKDLKHIPENEQYDYIFNFRKYFSAWLRAMAGNINTVIGRALTQSEHDKLREASEKVHKTLSEFIQWRTSTKHNVANPKEGKPKTKTDNPAESREQEPREVRYNGLTVVRGYDNNESITLIFDCHADDKIDSLLKANGLYQSNKVGSWRCEYHGYMTPEMQLNYHKNVWPVLHEFYCKE